MRKLHPFRKIKFLYQRARYGFCDSDIWNIDLWFLDIMPRMLDRLREITHGYPSSLESKEQWDEILLKMSHLFREANEETCSQKNEFEDVWLKAYQEFEEKYGRFGEKLCTEEEVENAKKGIHRLHTLQDVPEYEEIAKKHLDEMIRLDQYRDECKNEALQLFSEYFWDLWD